MLDGGYDDKVVGWLVERGLHRGSLGDGDMRMSCMYEIGRSGTNGGTKDKLTQRIFTMIRIKPNELAVRKLSEGPDASFTHLHDGNESLDFMTTSINDEKEKEKNQACSHCMQSTQEHSMHCLTVRQC